MERQTRTTRTLLLTAASLCTLVLVTTSCHDQLDDNGRTRTGGEIRFSAGIDRPEVSKTAYDITGSETAGGTVTIKWQRDDRIRIYCAEALEPKGQEGRSYADYWVTDDITDGGRMAAIEGLGGMGLRWNTTPGTVHHFYAMAPGPWEGHTAAKSIEKNEISATIPQEQNTLSGGLTKDGSGNWSLAPDMMWQLLGGSETYTYDTSLPGDVFMQFRPYSTAIQFTIENGSDTPLSLYRLEVLSEGHQISGDFTVDLDGDYAARESGTLRCTDITPVSSGTAGERSVTLSLPGDSGTSPSPDGVTLAKGRTMTFTVFLAPTGDVNDLTFKLYKYQSVDGGSGSVTYDRVWMSTKLAYNDGEKTGVLFPAKKMTFIKGLLVPDGAQWQVKYSADADAWDIADEGGIDARPEITPRPFATPWTTGYEEGKKMTKYYYIFTSSCNSVVGHAGGSESLYITSEREMTHPTKEPVLWHLEYWDDDAGKWIVPDETPYYIKDFVSFSKVSGINSGLQTVTMDIKAADPEKGEVETGVTHTSKLRGASPKGTSTAPWDLSMHDIQGNARAAGKPVTANSYVVSGPGVYAFPLVYGNGIDYTMAPAGGDNMNAYDPGSEMEPTVGYLTRFHNARGLGIHSPYIETDLKVEDISGWQAWPVWQDAPGNALIKDGACTVLTKDAAEARGLTACNSGYVMFEVPSTNLVQGNAVIAVSDGSGILWSWHVWVTDNDLTPVKVNTNDSFQVMEMMPVNLGWVDAGNAGETYYAGRELRVRLVQDGSEAVREFTVKRLAESTCTHTSGCGTYYQWGRKDAFIRSFNHSGTWSEYAEGDVTLHTASVPAISAVPYDATETSIGYSIEHPTHFVTTTGGLWYHAVDALGVDAHFYNLWSGLNGNAGTGIQKDRPLKTVYDPCPPGFSVPQGNGFSYFDPDYQEALGTFDGGYYFKTGYTAAGEALKIFIPASGYRSGSSGGLGSILTEGDSWTAAPSSEGSGYHLMLSSGTVQPMDYNLWPMGFSVRPVAE